MCIVFLPVITILLLVWYASNFKEREKGRLKKSEKYSIMENYNSAAKVNYYRYGIRKRHKKF
jgi:hypothetical protein